MKLVSVLLVLAGTLFANPLVLATNHGGLIASNEVWTKAANPHVIVSDVTVNAGVTLRIEPGVKVLFQTATRMVINGSLVAVALASDVILFTSVRDTLGTAVLGDWRNLSFTETSVNDSLVHCVVSYGGRDSYVAVNMSGCSPYLKDCEVKSNYGPALGCFSGSQSKIIDCTVHDNRLDAYYIDLTSFPDITYNDGEVNNWVFGNHGNGIRIDGGTLNQNAIWRDLGPAYHIRNNNLTVGQGRTLTLEPGVLMKFDLALSLIVNGTVKAIGTPSEKIKFTSYRDDDRQDTDGDGSSGGAWGEWRQISFTNTSVNDSLKNCIVSFGGRDANSMIRLFSTTSTIACSQLLSSYGPYIETDAAIAPTIANCIFTADVNRCGINNLNTTMTLNAEGNFWGDASGPYDPAGNPAGKGARACGRIDYSPWQSTWDGWCGDPVLHLAGQVVSCSSGRLVPGVQLSTTGQDTLAGVTSVSGGFELTVESPGQYDVCAAKTTNDGGVSVADVIKIRRHLARLEIFTSGCRYIAGDVDCSNSVSVADAIKIRRYLAHLDTLPCGNWTFISSGFPLDTANWRDYPSCRTEYVQDTSLNDVDFVGVRLGDVDLSWTPTLMELAAKGNTGNPVNLELKAPEKAVATHSVGVEVHANGNGLVAGFEVHLLFDSEQLRFKQVQSGLADEITTNVTGDTLHLVWDNINSPADLTKSPDLLHLMFEVIDSTVSSQSFELITAELADTGGETYNLSLGSRLVISAGESGSGSLPKEFSLSNAYPNPFNPSTRIDFALPVACHVKLIVYNVLGQEVRQLINAPKEAGNHSFEWDGKDASGRSLSSGIYLYRIEARHFSFSKKVVLLK